MSLAKRPADVPYGSCWCGCGEKTPVAKTNRTPRGWVAGEPIRYLRGHNRRGSGELSYVEVDTGFGSNCWNWTRTIGSKGYGKACRGGVNHNAHRAAYLDLVGPIAPGLVLDHLCRNRACINPAHMEPVTPRENVRRGRSFAIFETKGMS